MGERYRNLKKHDFALSFARLRSSCSISYHRLEYPGEMKSETTEPQKESGRPWRLVAWPSKRLVNCNTILKESCKK